jgi:hypothetical protein
MVVKVLYRKVVYSTVSYKCKCTIFGRNLWPSCCELHDLISGNFGVLQVFSGSFFLTDSIMYSSNIYDFFTWSRVNVSQFYPRIQTQLCGQLLQRNIVHRGDQPNSIILKSRLLKLDKISQELSSSHPFYNVCTRSS